MREREKKHNLKECSEHKEGTQYYLLSANFVKRGRRRKEDESEGRKG